MDMIHVIQKEILSGLMRNSALRYSQLKPKYLESNHFMYHLKALIREGLVEKRADGMYSLTTDGKLYADQVNLKTLKHRRQPKIVTLVAIQNSAGEWLLYQRKHQPLLGQIGFPYGKLHLGETVQEAAERELMEKTGLTCKLAHRGDGYIIIHENDEPVSQICFHLFYGKNPKGTMKTETHYGYIRWSNATDDFAQKPFMASMPDLIKLLDSHPKERFFVELTYK